MKYANIQPIKVQFNKPEATRLSVAIAGDNLTSSAAFVYTLLSDTSSVLDGVINISGEAYTEWDGNNDFPFSFCAENLGVEIIDFGDDTPVEEEITEE